MSSFAPTKVPKMHECRKERKRRTYRKSNQRAHHTHTTKMPPKFRQNHDCTLQVSLVHRCQVSAHPNLHPEVSQCAQIQGFGLPKRPSKFPPIQQSTPKFHNTLKSKVSDYLKRPSKFRDVYPSPPKTDTLQFLNLQNHLSRSQKVTKRYSEFLYTHEVREFLTIQRARPNTHTTPPKHFGVSDSLQNPLPFKGKIHTLGVSTDHHPRHRERAVIRLCACRKMPNTLADVNLP